MKNKDLEKLNKTIQDLNAQNALLRKESLEASLQALQKTYGSENGTIQSLNTQIHDLSNHLTILREELDRANQLLTQNNDRIDIDNNVNQNFGSQVNTLRCQASQKEIKFEFTAVKEETADDELEIPFKKNKTPDMRFSINKTLAARFERFKTMRSNTIDN